MKVQDIMTPSPETCRETTNLAAAVEQLWRADCGILPVTDTAGKLAGVITDRDICIALGTRNRPASDVTVADVMRRTVETCGADEDVSEALARMKQRRVRRLPVVDREARITGVLSLNDIVLAAGSGANAVKPSAVVETFKTICAHNVPVLVKGAA